MSNGLPPNSATNKPFNWKIIDGEMVYNSPPASKPHSDDKPPTTEFEHYPWKIVGGEMVYKSPSKPESGSNSAPDVWSSQKGAVFLKDNRYAVGQLIQEFIQAVTPNIGINTTCTALAHSPHFMLAVRSRYGAPPVDCEHLFAFIIECSAGEKISVSILGHPIFQPGIVSDSIRYKETKDRNNPQLLTQVSVNTGQSPRRMVERFLTEVFGVFQRYPQRLLEVSRGTAPAVHDALTAMCTERPVVVLAAIAAGPHCVPTE